MSKLFFFHILPFTFLLFLIFILRRIRKAFIVNFSKKETSITKSDEEFLLAVICGEYVFLAALIYFSRNFIYNFFMKLMI